MPIPGIVASQISGHLWAPIGSYDALATAIAPSGGLTSITFAGIPSGYKHLQIRATYQLNFSDSDWSIRFNGDTASNYSKHQIWGDGATVFSSATASTTSIAGGVNQTANANISVAVVDILDYDSVYKNKTVRTFTGSDSNGTGYNFLRSGGWFNSSTPITNISIIGTNGSTSFNQYSSFALYGVK